MSTNRRQFMHGLGAVALADLLRGGAPHFAPRAKRVIQIMCPGGVSHLDTFDYKPELEKRSGQPMPGGEKEVSFQGANGNLMRSPWKFVRRGQTGRWMTEMLPHLGALADEMAFIHSMTSRTNSSCSTEATARS